MYINALSFSVTHARTFIAKVIGSVYRMLVLYILKYVYIMHVVHIH